MKTLGWIVWAVGAVISIAWLWEARTCGVCYVSRHLAPIAIVTNIVWPFLLLTERSSRR